MRSPGQPAGLPITSINDAVRPGEPLVVTCRAEQYRDAVRPLSGPAATLRGAAAIQLCPLDPSEVASYLHDDAAGPITADRWDPVLAALGTQTPVGEALTTPLMVGLARTIYNPRPGEHAGELRDPEELCAPHSPTGQRFKLSCSTRSFPQPSGSPPLAAGRRRKPKRG